MMNKIQALAELIRRLFEVSRSQQKSIKSIVSDMRQFAALGYCSGISDYFEMRVFEDDVAQADWQNFCGWRALHKIDALLNPVQYRCLLNDKAIAVGEFKSAAIETVENEAVFYLDRPHLIGEEPETNFKALLHKLNADCFPLYVKPIYGGTGAGIFLLQAVSDDFVDLYDKGRLSIDEFESLLSQKRQYVQYNRGYVFQRRVTQHPEITRLTGSDSASTLRIIVTHHQQQSEVGEVIMRIIGGQAITDNLAKGMGENLVAAIDSQSGKIKTCYSGYGYHQQAVECHPKTNASFTQFKVPFFDEAVALAERAARHFPMLKFTHWDIAISEKGPIIIEGNVTGAITTVQSTHRRGLLKPLLRKAVEATKS